MCVTSPPYYALRDYGHAGQIGQEVSPYEYADRLVEVFREVRRVLKDDGTLWLNLGDTYANKKGWGKIKPKDMIGVPWALAFALRDDGWYLRSEIIWHKTNPMPEGTKTRPTKSHEHVFLLSKSYPYYFNYEAIQEPVKQSTIDRTQYAVGIHKYTDGAAGQAPQGIYKPHKKGSRKPPEFVRKRDVWSCATSSYKGAHFATFPLELVTTCVLAGCPENGVVLDPFFGAGTTCVAAVRSNRQYIGFEINHAFCELARVRLTREGG
jgi:DNA modification methylase